MGFSTKWNGLAIPVRTGEWFCAHMSMESSISHLSFTVFKIVEDLGPHVTRQDTGMRKEVPVEVRIAAF